MPMAPPSLGPPCFFLICFQACKGFRCPTSGRRLTANTGLINVQLSGSFFFFFFREFITAIFPPSTIEINDQRLQNNNYKVLHHPRGVQLLESSRPKTFFQPSVTLWLYGFGFMARCYSYNLKFCVQVYEDKSRRLRLPLEAPNSHNSL